MTRVLSVSDVMRSTIDRCMGAQLAPLSPTVISLLVSHVKQRSREVVNVRFQFYSTSQGGTGLHL